MQSSLYFDLSTVQYLSKKYDESLDSALQSVSLAGSMPDIEALNRICAFTLGVCDCLTIS